MNKVIFNEIQALKRQLIPTEKMILFGSQARGDAREDSDWDLLFVLNKDGRHYWDDYDKYAYPFSELGWNYGVEINPILYTKEEWEKRKITMLYKYVEGEGIEIK